MLFWMASRLGAAAAETAAETAGAAADRAGALPVWRNVWNDAASDSGDAPASERRVSAGHRRGCGSAQQVGGRKAGGTAAKLPPAARRHPPQTRATPGFARPAPRRHNVWWQRHKARQGDAPRSLKKEAQEASTEPGFSLHFASSSSR